MFMKTYVYGECGNKDCSKGMRIERKVFNEKIKKNQENFFCSKIVPTP